MRFFLRFKWLVFTFVLALNVLAFGGVASAQTPSPSNRVEWHAHRGHRGRHHTRGVRRTGRSGRRGRRWGR
jgi:hypothetical protein